MLRMDPFLFSILTHLFHDTFCPPTATHKFGMNLTEFAAWLTEFPSFDDVKATAMQEIPESDRSEAWERFIKFAKTPVTEIIDVIAPIWSILTLADKPKPQNEVESISASVVIRYRDGRVSLYSNGVAAESLANKMIADATAVDFLQTTMIGFTEYVAKKGIDGCHAESTDTGGEHPFRVLIGAFRSIIPQLDPSLHVYLERYMRMAQTLIRPPLSFMTTTKSKRRETETIEITPREQGGFAVGKVDVP